MRLSRLADYAVLTMTAAARHPVGARLSATIVADETGVPLPTVQKVMQQLTRAGLLTSIRGAAGGFALNRDATAITLADIVEAVEGPIALNPCSSDLPYDCAMGGHCQTKPHWRLVNATVRDALASVPLTRLANIA